MALENERIAYNPIMFPGVTGGQGTDGLGLGGGLIGGLLLGALLRNGNGGLFGNGTGAGAELAAGDIAAQVVNLQNTSNIREEIGTLGNELQAAFATQTQGQTAQFNQVADLVMASSKENALLAKDAIIAGMVNTQSIKDQASAFQVINQENFCAIKELIHSDGDATRALITTNLIDGLRAELAGERRGRDQREIEINVSQSNQQTQAQLQSQLQSQTQFFATCLNSLGDQIARQTNSLINIGSGTVAGSGQTSNVANTKVNS